MRERIAMNQCVGIEMGIGLALLAGSMSLLQAQSGTLAAGAVSGSALPSPHISANSEAAIEPVTGQVLRIIEDPGTGHRWMLLRDESHPGGPGKLILGQDDGTQAARALDAGISAHADAVSLTSSATSSAMRDVDLRSRIASSPASPVIHAGDHLSVEQHTAVADVQLAATALGPAAKGSAFNIRLEIGGRVMRAIAEGPGHASFAPRTEGQP